MNVGSMPVSECSVVTTAAEKARAALTLDEFVVRGIKELL